MGHGSRIVQEVSSWDGIEAHPHRFGGTEFKIGNVEVGHIHGDFMVDIPYTVKIREVLLADGEASPHHLLPESGWISFYLRKEADVAQAIKLYRISYLQKQMRRAKPDERAAYQNEIETLEVSESVKSVLLNRASIEE